MPKIYSVEDRVQIKTNEFEEWRLLEVGCFRNFITTAFDVSAQKINTFGTHKSTYLIRKYLSVCIEPIKIHRYFESADLLVFCS